MKAAYGKVAQVKDIPSQQITRVVLELPIEFHVEATQLFYGQNCLLTIAPSSIAMTGYGIHEPGKPLPPKEEPSKGGPLMVLAGVWCKDPMFTKFLAQEHESVFNAAEGQEMTEEGRNAWCVRKICQVASRRDLDGNVQAKIIFDAEIRRPYAAFQVENKV